MFILNQLSRVITKSNEKKRNLELFYVSITIHVFFHL